MKKRALYIFLLFLFSAFLYSQKAVQGPVIDENDIASLIPENFVRNPDIQVRYGGTCTDKIKKSLQKNRYTYTNFNVNIAEVPREIDSLFSFTEIESFFNKTGYIKQQDIYKLLNTASNSNAHVLLKEAENAVAWNKIFNGSAVAGEMQFQYIKPNADTDTYRPYLYVINCVFLQRADTITYINFFCEDRASEADIVRAMSVYFKQGTAGPETWVFKDGKAEQDFKHLLETRSERLPAWLRTFLDYYDKLYISVQNLFDMQLPLETTVFYTQANLNIRDKAGTDGTKLRMITKGTRLRLLEIGAKDKIDGITAPWVKVRLQDGTEGWCFAGYVAARKP